MIYYKFTQLESIYYFCEIDYVFKTEQWLPVIGYEGIYEVSDLGRVKSLDREILARDGKMYSRKGVIMKASIMNKGYLVSNFRINTSTNTMLRHQIVAISFLGHEVSSRQIVIDHKNNNRLDNRLINLQKTTQRNNSSKDQFRQKRYSKLTGVTWDKHRDKWVSRIRIKGKLIHLGSFVCEIEAGDAYKDKLKSIKHLL